ncbi:GDSL-type esterase/lipase family protein [Congregicoccus parvus]|uniref:GDSL-type esterase/lipase family protein n=1 Tax=Congregicoccus parvus TaxID=3081749 RepID=UPI003FA5AE5F
MFRISTLFQLAAASVVVAEVAHDTKPLPSFADVPYGEDERQTLDFYRATDSDDSSKPTPVVFFIHGGGWTYGDKSDVGKTSIERVLAAGISVVSINYRYVSAAREAGATPPVSWPMHDAARALQFVRFHAAAWNIDPDRIALTGTSAGGCTALWLAFHDDLADFTSSDPVARQSTRVYCVAVDSAQTTLDPLQMREWIPNSRYGGHAFGFATGRDDATREQAFADLVAGREQVASWISEYSPFVQATPDDPPVYLYYHDRPAFGRPSADPTHSAEFGVKLQEHLEVLGVPCELVHGGTVDVAHPDTASYLVATLESTEPLPLAFIRNLEAGRRQTVVLYGTSLTHTAEWPHAMQHFFDADWPGRVNLVNASLSGRQSRWGMENLEKRVLVHHPDLVFIEFSINDAATKHGISPDRAIEHLDNMVRRLREQNPAVEIVLQTMNPVFNGDDGKNAADARPRLDHYYAGYRHYARRHHLPLLDHYAAWLRLRARDPAAFEHAMPDGTHPIPEYSRKVTWAGIESMFSRSFDAARTESKR